MDLIGICSLYLFMKNYLLLTALIIAAVFVAGCTQQTPVTVSQNGTNSVAIQNFAFSPASLTVKTGEAVVWTNEDSAAHTIVSDTGNEINSLSLSTGQSYSHTFSTAGTYAYHCSIHPSMKATITVE